MSSTNKEFLPEEKLPECWKDEARMNVLFAPFRSRSTNPKDWDSKLLFWKNLISVYCIHNRVFTFTLRNLLDVFSLNCRSPACLAIVIDELYKIGELQSLDKFLQKPAETWGTWAADVFIKKPALWSFNKIKSAVIIPDTEIVYVHLHAVDEESEKLLSSIPDNLKNKVINLKDLTEIERLCSWKIESLKILLHHLLCQGKVSIKEIGVKNRNLENTTLIKFCDIKKYGAITNIDVDVYTLEQSERTLITNIEKLENEVVSLIADAKSYLLKGHKQSAKTCLRKKREVEKCIEKRANTLHNIQILLSRIQDLDSDVQVLDSYKKVLSRLRLTFSETGLNEESVSNTMSELDEVLEIHNDIQSTLAQGSLSGNDGDLEAELAELIASDKIEPTDGNNSSPPANKLETDLVEELKALDIKLPSPPSNEPLVKTKLSL